MKRFMKAMGFLSIAMVLMVGISFGQSGNRDPYRALPNLSFPVLMTDIIQDFFLQVWTDADLDGKVDQSEVILDYDIDNDGFNEMTEPTPIPVTEDISVKYLGTYPGNEGFTYEYYTLDETGCAVDVSGPLEVPDGVIDDYDMTKVDLVAWLTANAPWYTQPLSTTSLEPSDVWNVAYVTPANSWQADWIRQLPATDTIAATEPDFVNHIQYVAEPVAIDFIDWGNPLENIYPTVGKRFPVEVTLYEKFETPIKAYKGSVLEYESSKEEWFGVTDQTLDDVLLGANETDFTHPDSSFAYYCYFATVMTNKFFCEVWNPDGSITKIPVGPGIGPSGKMNFASEGGGWMPRMPGWHRIWLHINDPLITLAGAVVNNDEHYVMWTGCHAQDLNKNKLEQCGVVGDSTFVDVYVSAKIPKKVKK